VGANWLIGQMQNNEASRWILRNDEFTCAPPEGWREVCVVARIERVLLLDMTNSSLIRKYQRSVVKY